MRDDLPQVRAAVHAGQLSEEQAIVLALETHTAMVNASNAQVREAAAGPVTSPSPHGVAAAIDAGLSERADELSGSGTDLCRRRVRALIADLDPKAFAQRH